jgi:scyllo-inositol 2-dehydrogenase (NADP+)
MTKPIKIGIVGLGRAGWGMHCEELELRKDTFEIVAACDIIPERRAQMVERYGCKTYANIADMITDPDVELVDIATRSCDHYKHASMALATGKKVFLEKPMCVSFDEAQKLQQAADHSPGGKLYIRHNRRFDPDFLHVKEIMQSGLLGDVYEIRLARHGYQRRDDWQTIKAFGGGQLLNWGPHIVDHSLFFLDSPVASQFSTLKRITAVGDAEDHIKIVLKGENGRLVDMEISGGVALGAPTYQVFGSSGSLVLTGNKMQLKYLDPNVALTEKQANPGTPGATFGSQEQLPWIEESIPVKPGSNAIIWDALYSTIRGGAAFPISMEQALAVMRVISTAKIGTEF